LQFGSLPIRAETIIVGRHFHLRSELNDVPIIVKGTFEPDGLPTGDLLVGEPNARSKPTRFDLRDDVRPEATLRRVRDELLEQARQYSAPDQFFFATRSGDIRIQAAGIVEDHHFWRPHRLAVSTRTETRQYTRLSDVPQPFRSRLDDLLAHEGLEHANLVRYVREHGSLPSLDWAVLVAFIGIAGAGGLTNTLFSNYARDKGWGMGRHVGAIPSALGRRMIGLSHTGRVFPIDEPNHVRWRGWMRHIVRDQAIWVVASVVGMALPCMMSLEFIRNATVTGDRVAAMTAEGIAHRFPEFGNLFWYLTLLCGFLVLAPGQVSASDQLARRWTDIVWSASDRVKRLGAGEVWKIYYGILAVYALWGLFVLCWLPALQIAKIGAVLQTIALGFSALHALQANRTLLPSALRPHWLLQIGVVAGGLFFMVVAIAGAAYL
jgi:hypothetical protein